MSFDQLFPTGSVASKALLESLADAALLVDANGAVLSANSAAAELLGRERRSLRGLDLAELFEGRPLGGPGEHKLWLARRRELDVELRPAVGEALPARVISSPLLAAAGQPAAALLIIREPARPGVLAEHSQELDRAQLCNSLMDFIKIGMFRTSGGPTGRYIIANQALASMLGFTSVEDLLRAPVAELYENPLERKVAVEDVMLKGEVRERKLRLRRCDGSAFDALCSSRARFDEAGNLLWIDGIIEALDDK